MAFAINNPSEAGNAVSSVSLLGNSTGAISSTRLQARRSSGMILPVEATDRDFPGAHTAELKGVFEPKVEPPLTLAHLQSLPLWLVYVVPKDMSQDMKATA